MRKYPPDVNVSETCIDANLKMVERREPDNFLRFPPQEWCAWTNPKLPLKSQEKNASENVVCWSRLLQIIV